MSNQSCTERKQFSHRLSEAMASAGYSAESPTQLAREFNARHGGRPVTVHAARKWIVGDAIPTQDKLQVLSTWLGVTAEWLRFGSGQQDCGSAAQRIDSASVSLVSDIQRLSQRDQMLVREFVRSLVRLNRIDGMVA